MISIMAESAIILVFCELAWFDTHMSAESSTRGRPPVVSDAELQDRALSVIEQEGYSAVSMAQIATFCGVSVRTLHRHFPSKADIVWGGFEYSLQALQESIAKQTLTTPLMETIEGVLTEVFDLNLFQSVDASAQFNRRKLALIAQTPELVHARSETFDDWRKVLAALIAGRIGDQPDGLVANVLGRALHSAIMEALTWWATNGGEKLPRDVVIEALGGFAHLVHANPS